MASLPMLTSKALKTIIYSLFLIFSIVSSARILDQTIPLPDPTSDPVTPPETVDGPTSDPVTPPETVDGPVASAPVANVAPIIPTEPAAPIPAVTPPITTPSNGGGAVVTTAEHPTLSFFMHDILGGSQPSGRVVTGVVASSDASALPFSVPNNQIFPLNGGVPLNTINGVVNDNNYPFLVGLNGGVAGAGSGAGTLLQSNGNNVQSSNDNQPFVTAGQLPQGLTLQQLMFGSLTVVDNEMTEGHELGTAVLGRMQGFYIASSSDGSAHTLALTALFHGEVHEHEHEHEHGMEETVSFFGIHRTATPVSHIAIIGGTGRYENAKGYATIETLPHIDQHTTDGLETITHFTLYITP